MDVPPASQLRVFCVASKLHFTVIYTSTATLFFDWNLNVFLIFVIILEVVLVAFFSDSGKELHDDAEMSAELWLTKSGFDWCALLFSLPKILFFFWINFINEVDSFCGRLSTRLGCEVDSSLICSGARLNKQFQC